MGRILVVKMIKVCHVIFNHNIFDGRIFHKEVLSLANHGYDVTVLAPETIERHGKNQIKADSIINQKHKNVRINFYKYNKYIPNLIRSIFTTKEIKNQLISINADIYHFHEDGLLLEIAAEFKEWLPDKKLIFDFHEFFLHRIRHKKSKKVAKYTKHENKLLVNADLFITVSDFITGYYKTLTQKPVITIMNCQSEKIMSASNKEIDLKKSFWIVHEGNLYFDRGLKLLIEVARFIKKPEIKFLIIGKLPEKELIYFQQKTKEYGTEDRFHFTGFLPYEEVADFLNLSKAGLVLRLSANAQTGLPNKFFNYLRFGLPIISLKNVSSDNIILEHNLGFIFSNNEAEKIANIIDNLSANNSLYKKLSKNAFLAFKTKYNWEQMEQKLLDAYEMLK